MIEFNFTETPQKLLGSILPWAKKQGKKVQRTE